MFHCEEFDGPRGLEDVKISEYNSYPKCDCGAGIGLKMKLGLMFFVGLYDH